MKHIELTCRLVFTVDNIAKARGITCPRKIDELAGIATRTLAKTGSEGEALEAVRTRATAFETDITIDNIMSQLIASASSYQFLQHQAG